MLKLETINLFCWEERNKLLWYGFVCAISPTYFNLFYSLYAIAGTALYKQNIKYNRPPFSLEQDKLKFKLDNKDVTMDLARSFNDSIDMQFASMLHKVGIGILGNEGIAISILYCYYQYTRNPAKYNAIEAIASLLIMDDFTRFLAINLYSTGKEFLNACMDVSINIPDLIYKNCTSFFNNITGFGYGFSRGR